MRTIILASFLGISTLWAVTGEIKAYRLEQDLAAADAAWNGVVEQAYRHENDYIRVAIDYGMSEACSLRATD